ncbi:uncharacterized protein LOC109950930 [Corvus cornix cornix]|uniref:uncharacterized protein LOC109950930 n=1 Tax=Corvus cornix cornix TaxID=932674 RepID=UPI00194E9597|nr:uncharacterized protein LOC109950930 [Corvus cornix cornix]
MEMVAKELLAMVLENLGNRLESKASEQGRAPRRKEQPVDGGATRADKSKEAETASSYRARVQALLDNLTRQVDKSVSCLLKSMVASQFEEDSSCEYAELPRGKVSNRQMQPGFPGASEEQSQESSTGVKLPALGPQLHAEGTGCAKTVEPEDPAMVKESLIHVPGLSFNLDDPYLHQFSLKYNCLHDPHLRYYHNRKDILRLLKRQGFVTCDNKVVCTVKDFNEYRHYLTQAQAGGRTDLGAARGAERLSRQHEPQPGVIFQEWLLPPLAKLKVGLKLPGTTDTSCQAERHLKPQKPSCPHPQKSRETPLKSGRFRRRKIAFDEGQTYSRAELGQDDASTAAGSQRKPDNTADGLFKAVFERLTAVEAQKLQDVVEAIVHKVFARLKVPRDQRVNFLRNAAQGIRGTVFSSCMRTEPVETPLDHHQEMEMVAKELLAMVLENLGNRLESKASEQGRAPRRKEQPVDGGATRADKSKEAETASSDRARVQALLDNLTRQVIESVHCLLKSMVASQFEEDSSCEYAELPRGPELPAEGTGCAETLEPEDPAVEEKEVEDKEVEEKKVEEEVVEKKVEEEEVEEEEVEEEEVEEGLQALLSGTAFEAA